MRKAAAVFVGALVLAAVPVPARAQEKVTVDWMYSDAGENATKMPQFAWAANDDLLLLDETRPENKRTLERFTPATGARRPAVDAAKALASLTQLVGADAVSPSLGWPDDIDDAGTEALYTIGDDLFVLDLAASRFERLTSTPESETVARFSPDGRKVAFVRGNDLWVVDVASRAATRLTDDGSDTILNGALSWLYWEEVFNHGDAGYWWAPDSSAIAFLRSDESQVTEMLYSDIAPAVPRVIRQRYPVAGGVNPTVRLGIVDVTGGAPRFVDDAAMPHEYVLGVTWLADSAGVAVQVTNRQQTRLDLYRVARTDAAAQRILTEKDDAWVDQQEIVPLADGRFVWTSQRDGYTHLYVVSADGAQATKLTDGAWSVRGPKSFYAEPLYSTWVDEARGVVYFTAMNPSPIQRQLFRVDLDGSGLQRVSAEEGSHDVDFSPDHRYYVDTFSAHCTPPTLAVHQVSGALVAVLGRSRPDLLTDFDWQCPELLTVPAADGRALHVRLIKPKPFDPAKRYPAVVYIYGGPSAPVVRDSFAYSFARNAEYDQILVHSGYVVMNVDPRSATAASKADQNAVVGDVWGDHELADMLAGVHWLKAQPFVDSDRVGVWGWSGGGTSTLLLMTRSTEFKAGIAVAPAVDWHYYDTKFTETYMKTPADNPEGYAHTSFFARAKDLHGRLYLIDGTYDDNVHPQQMLRLVDELITAHKPFDVMVYPMRKHIIEDRPARIDLFKRMLEFWERNL